MGADIAMSCCPRTITLDCHNCTIDRSSIRFISWVIGSLMEHMHLLGGFCCAGRGRQGGPQLTGALLAFAPPPTEGASASARAYERVLLECIYAHSRARVASGGGVRCRRLHAIRQDSGGSNAAHMCAFLAYAAHMYSFLFLAQCRLSSWGSAVVSDLVCIEQISSPILFQGFVALECCVCVLGSDYCCTNPCLHRPGHANVCSLLRSTPLRW
jgi:hypothetical protein